MANSANPVGAADTVSIDEVVVTGNRSGIRQSQVAAPISIINDKTLTQKYSDDLPQALSEEIPGLFVTGSHAMGYSGYGSQTLASGSINMRGMSGSAGRVLVLVDGHPQYAAIYGHSVADSYLSGQTQRVEVSRGPASVLYGSNAMGGAINIVTKEAEMADGKKNHLNVNAMGGSYGSFRLTAQDHFKLKDFKGRLSAGYESSEGHRPNSAFRSGNIGGQMNWELNKHWNVDFQAKAVKFYSENPGSESDPLVEGYADILRTDGSVALNDSYERVDGQICLYGSWGRHVIDDGYGLSGSPQPYLFHSTDFLGGVNLFETICLYDSNHLTVGTDMRTYGGNAYRNPETERYADHIRLNEEAVYLLDRQEAGPVGLSAGIRWQHHQTYGNEWIPQGGITWKAAAYTRLKASVSKGFRTPNMKELYMYASANEDLLPERCWSYDLSWLQAWCECRLQTELSLFRIEGDNLVEVVRENNKPQNRNVGSFCHQGVEASARWQSDERLALSGNFSYLHMGKAIVGSPRLKAFFKADYRPSEACSICPSLQYVDGLYLTTGANAETSRFFLLNLKASYRTSPMLAFFLKADNLLNQTYQTIAGLPMPGLSMMAGLSVDL